MRPKGWCVPVPRGTRLAGLLHRNQMCGRRSLPLQCLVMPSQARPEWCYPLTKLERTWIWEKGSKARLALAYTNQRSPLSNSRPCRGSRNQGSQTLLLPSSPALPAGWKPLAQPLLWVTFSAAREALALVLLSHWLSGPRGDMIVPAVAMDRRSSVNSGEMAEPEER